MASFFSGSELMKVAIGIEQRGIVFYETMAHSTQNIGARQVFAELVDMERSHIEVFESMLTDKDKYSALESHPAGYDDYLKALIDTAVFTDELITGEQASAAETDIKAVELAIAIEKDSILFYDQNKLPSTLRSGYYLNTNFVCPASLSIKFNLSLCSKVEMQGELHPTTLRSGN